MSNQDLKSGQTLYDKIWDQHVVSEAAGHPAVVYVDLHLVHECSFLQAFETLRAKNLKVRRPPLTLAVTDHSVPSDHADRFGPVDRMPYVIGSLLEAADEFGLEIYGPNDENQGIVHVIGPELGLSQPGMVIVCADSHTSTHGAMGALAFGIGTTEIGHIAASQTLLQRKQLAARVNIDGRLAEGVSSKDLALALLAKYGVEFGRGHVIEFAGPAIRAMSMEARMSLCNMAIEMGSRSGIIAPDETTIGYLLGRRFSPRGQTWEDALVYWQGLRSDDDAVFDIDLQFDASSVVPMVTYGTNPGMGIPVDGQIPFPESIHDLRLRTDLEQSLSYMSLSPGDHIGKQRIDRVFIGSCTNSRIEDLRLAASVLRGRKIAQDIELKVVPGSQAVKRQAEREGLDQVFLTAGGTWDEPSCSLCVGINGDLGRSGQYIASTSNRNFKGRQGPGVRTILMSPATAAATAVEGFVADPRKYVATMAPLTISTEGM